MRTPTALATVTRACDGVLDRAGAFVDTRTEVIRRHGRELREWWREQPALRETLPLVLFVSLVIFYFIVMERLVWQRHARFGTFDYDLGIYDQATWLLAHGRGFMTVRGMQVFGHHANVGFYLFVPAYWLGAGPQFLDIMNTLAITAGAVPLYALARHHLKSEWAGLAIGAAYLFHFVPQWLIVETFHPECMALPFVLGAFYFATVGRWKHYWWCILAALIWKEDVALVVMMMGIVVAFVFHRRRTGLLTFIAGGAWLVVATRLLMPALSPGGAAYDSYFGALGPTASDVVINSIRNPRLFGRTLGQHGAEKGAMAMFRAYGYVPLGGPQVLLIGLPQHIINFLSIQAFTYNPRTHYFTFPFAATSLAAVRTVVTRQRVLVSWLLVFVMLGGVIATRDEGAGPWSAQGFVQADNPLGNRTLEAAMRTIPKGANVSAAYYLVPHLAHRPEIYTFPNPWRASYYGPDGHGHRDSARVQYVIVDRHLLSAEDQDLFNSILHSGRFTPVFRKGEMFVLKRVGPH